MRYIRKRGLILLCSFACICLSFAAVSAEEPATMDLQAAIAAAQKVDSGVLNAQASVATSEAAVKAKMAQLAPGCTVKTDGGLSTTGQASVGVTVTVAGVQPELLPRFAGEQVASDVDKALWDLAEAKAKLVQAQVTAAVNTINKYLNVLKAERSVTLSQSALDLAKDDERMANEKLAAGTAIKMDTLNAESQRKQAELNLTEAQSQQRQAMDALLLQIGQPLGGELTLAPVSATQESLDNIPTEDDVEALCAQAMQNRSDAIGSRYSVQKAQDSLAQCRNEALPTVQLTATGHAGPLTLSASLDPMSGDLNWSAIGALQATSGPVAPDGSDLDLGVSLTWHPFDGGLQQATLDQAQIGLESAQRQLANMEDQIRLELRGDIDNLKLSLLRLEQARNQADLAKQSRDLAELRYSEGVALFSELAQATQSLAQAQSSVAQAEYDVLMARVTLESDCGQQPSLISGA